MCYPPPPQTYSKVFYAEVAITRSPAPNPKILLHIILIFSLISSILIISTSIKMHAIDWPELALCSSSYFGHMSTSALNICFTISLTFFFYISFFKISTFSLTLYHIFFTCLHVIYILPDFVSHLLHICTFVFNFLHIFTFVFSFPISIGFTFFPHFLSHFTSVFQFLPHNLTFLLYFSIFFFFFFIQNFAYVFWIPVQWWLFKGHF